MRKMRYWVAWGALCAAAAAVVVWFVTRETLPVRIRIATARSGGSYYRLGMRLADSIQQRTGRGVDVIESDGSRQNLELLASGDADLAILQLGPRPPDSGVLTVAPLYDDFVHVVVRADRRIASIHDLDGRRILIGPASSGMRESADVVLEHYDIDTSQFEDTRYFTSLLNDPELDGAIVTAGLSNPDLVGLLQTGQFSLLPIDQAEAIAARYPLMTPRMLARGVYRGAPPLPPDSIATLATPAILVVRTDAPDVLVTEALGALYAGSLQREFPGLTTSLSAATWSLYPRHAAAQAYYDPYQGLGVLANFMETLAAIKELLLALGAGLYALFAWWRSIERREREAELAGQKDHLDQLIEATASIERAQLHEHDVKALEHYRDAVVEVKHRALVELTQEEVRGDRMFSILLLQAEAVSRAIDAKLARVSLGSSKEA